jgi:hypothetical protein
MIEVASGLATAIKTKEGPRCRSIRHGSMDFVIMERAGH